LNLFKNIEFRPSVVSNRVSFQINGNITFKISLNSSLTIISFDFLPLNNSFFDHLLVTFGQITLISCSFVNLTSINSIIITYASASFVNVSIRNVSAFFGFIQGLSSMSSLYIFDGLFVENLNLQKPITASFFVCHICSIFVKNSYFR